MVNDRLPNVTSFAPFDADADAIANADADDASAGRRDHGARLRDWLVDAVLPRWADTGVDRVRGGFVERIALDGRPVEAPRRTRVVARQVYVFATAARFGWHAAADSLVERGLAFLTERSLLGDGRFAGSVTPDGQVVDARFDLYEQAFVLFAWAAALRDRPDRGALRGRALALLQVLRDGWGHAEAGFEESAPPTAPLRANPHMHLLEAALAWEALSRGADRDPWAALADELAKLGMRHLIDPHSGALLELFDRAWRADGRLVEPGHQFEWAWLLMRWAALRGRDDAHVAARRLLEVGERHGVDRGRGVAINALDAAGFAATDPAAKLWPQTERVKAWQLALRLAPDPVAARHAGARLAEAVAGLERFRIASPSGLWHEQLNADGSFALQDCRASSLYHIVCAVETLQGDAQGDVAA